MTRKRTTPHEPSGSPGEGRLHKLEEAIHDRLVAAEVAAEEAAAYGSVTAAVEAAEAALHPEHELGDAEEAEQPSPRPPA